MTIAMTKLREKAVLAAWEEVQLHSLRFTMADVTRRLHMSKSSLYKIVPSKDDLVHAMLDYVIDSFERREKEIRSSGESIVHQIRCFVEVYLSLVKPMMVMGFYRDLELQYPEEYERWQEFYRQKIEVTMTMLQQGVDEGVFRPVSLPVVQHCLYVSAAALTDASFLQKYNLTHREAIESLEDILFRGILAAPGKEEEAGQTERT